MYPIKEDKFRVVPMPLKVFTRYTHAQFTDIVFESADQLNEWRCLEIVRPAKGQYNIAYLAHLATKVLASADGHIIVLDKMQLLAFFKIPQGMDDKQIEDKLTSVVPPVSCSISVNPVVDTILDVAHQRIEMMMNNAEKNEAGYLKQARVARKENVSLVIDDDPLIVELLTNILDMM